MTPPNDDSELTYFHTDRPPQPAAKIAPAPRHAVSLWFLLLGIIAFIVGVTLLVLDDGGTIRPQSDLARPRAEAPSARMAQKISAAAIATSATGVTLSQDQTFPPEFLSSLWAAADAAGISRRTFDQAFAAAAGPDPEVVALDARQPEFDRTVGDYVTTIVSDARVAAGRAALAKHAAVLGDIERRFGIDRTVLVAIWGIESKFGNDMGGRSVIRSLATLAIAEPRRAAAWRTELLAALTIIERDQMLPEQLTGSWAGAMGHTQLMPSAYLKNAVDFDGDGRRDIWGSVADALASTAKYLVNAGWQQGVPWGREVSVPHDFDFAYTSETSARSISAWTILGVRTPSGETLKDNDTNAWRLIVPSGAGGPAFLVTRNFDALLSYNPALSYALAVSLLSERLASDTHLSAPWPSTDLPMSREQRTELQLALTALGYDCGPADGIIGVRTREAIRAYQKASALPADAHPSPALLARVRTGRRL